MKNKSDLIKDELLTGGYILLTTDDYKDSKQKLDVEKDGYKYQITMNHFRRGIKKRLFYVGNKYYLYNIQKYLDNNKINLKVLDIQDIPKNSHTNIFFECGCGKIYEAYLYNIKNGKCLKCPSCSATKRGFDNRQTVDIINKKLYSFGSELIATKRIDRDFCCYRCSCGNEFLSKINNVRWNKQIKCSVCNSRISSLELKTKKLLEDSNIFFETQYQFDGCKNKRVLSFDFYIKNLNICIEVQGEQHYSEIKLYSKDFNNMQKRDNIKRKYCKENNIKLIEVPWYLYKTEEYKTYILHEIYN